MPIDSHSKQTTGLIIFSVFNADKGDYINISQHTATKKRLKEHDISFKEVEGVYKGSKELSFIVSDEKAEIIEAIARQNKQESILYLGKVQAHGVRKATLRYLEGKEEVLGWFRDRPKEIALQQDSYTYDFTTDKYFIIEDNYIKAGKGV